MGLVCINVVIFHSMRSVMVWSWLCKVEALPGVMRLRIWAVCGTSHTFGARTADAGFLWPMARLYKPS